MLVGGRSVMRRWMGMRVTDRVRAVRIFTSQRNIYSFHPGYQYPTTGCPCDTTPWPLESLCFYPVHPTSLLSRVVRPNPVSSFRDQGIPVGVRF